MLPTADEPSPTGAGEVERESGMRPKAPSLRAVHDGEPLLTPAAFAKLTRKKMMARLKPLGLARGKSRARKAELAAVFRGWYDETIASREPPPAAETREAPAGDAPTEDRAPTDEAPAQEPPATDEAPAGEAPADEAPVEEAPVEEAPVEEAPVEEAPVEESSVEEAPVEEAATEEAATEEAAAEEAPAGAAVEPEESTESADADADADFELDIAPSTEQRRRSDRVQLSVDIGYRSQTNFYVGFSTDVSEGGLFVATIHLLPRDCPVRVSFVLPGGVAIEAEGKVAWVRDPRSFDSSMRSGIGIAFANLTEAQVAAIQAYMDVREPLFYID